MKDQVLFSIIIPVYKVEEYLARSIDSVLAQTFDNWELYLVDDGSPDKSGEICDSYAESDSRITVIHKENGGLSSARNKALDCQLRGEYVIFMDSDDYWKNENGLQEIADRIGSRHEDIILFAGVSKDHITGEENLFRGNYDLSIFDNFPKGEIVNYLIRSNKFPGSAWIFTSKRSLIEEHHLRFPLNVTAEDFYWQSSLVYYACSIGAVNNDFYVYVVNRGGSITSTPRLSGLYGIHYAISRWYEHSDWESYTGITSYLAYAFLISLYNYDGLGSEDKREGVKLLQQDVKVLIDSKRTVYYCIYIMIKLLGYRVVSKILNFLHK